MRRLDLALTALLPPLDLIALLAAATTAYALRVSQPFLEARPILQEIPFTDYLLTSLPFILVWMGCYLLAGLYSAKRTPLWQDFGRIVLASTAGVMILIATIFFRREVTASRFLVLAVWGLAIGYSFIGRILIRTARYILLSRGVGHQCLAIIGTGHVADSLSFLYKQRPSLGYTVVKRYKAWNKAVREELKELHDKRRVDGVLLAEPSPSKEEALDLIAFTEEQHLTFRYLADTFAARFTRIDVSTEEGIPIIEPKRTPLDGWGRITKRVFDVIVASLMLAIASPIMIITAILIKLDSRGTVFFSKLPNGKNVERVGEHGHPFHYFKFRSMVADQHFMRYNELADLNMRVDGPLVKTKNDPRITRVGRVIRKWSIDELPELILVILGRMSLVGPRPHYPEEVAKYTPEQRRVLGIKPGITGMAQVSGRSDLTFDEEVRLDTWYIEHWSLWLDLVILFKTPITIIAHRGVEEGS